MSVHRKKDNPLLFGFKKAGEGCVSSNEGEVGVVRKAITEYLDVREVIDKTSGTPLKDTREATKTITTQDVLPFVGVGNLLFNGNGEDGTYLQNHAAAYNYTTEGPPLFWDVAGGVTWEDGCDEGFEGYCVLKTKTSIMPVGPQKLYQYVGQYVSDQCDDAALGNFKSILYLPYYTFKFKLLEIKGTWTAAIVARDAANDNLNHVVKAQKDISPTDLYPDAGGMTLDVSADGTYTDIVANIGLTWIRNEFKDPLLGVQFVPQGTVDLNTHSLKLDCLQLTPTPFPLDIDLPPVWGDRWILWFYADTSLDYDDFLLNNVGTQDGYDLPFNFICDYIQVRLYGGAIVGDHTATAYNDGNIITNGVSTLKAVGSSADIFWDHEHFALTGGGGPACRYVGTGRTDHNLNINFTTSFGVGPSDYVIACLSGYRIR